MQTATSVQVRTARRLHSKGTAKVTSGRKAIVVLAVPARANLTMDLDRVDLTDPDLTVMGQGRTAPIMDTATSTRPATMSIRRPMNKPRTNLG